jgi:radical SAM protein with 4Fe4S-binding SPASM domain
MSETPKLRAFYEADSLHTEIYDALGASLIAGSSVDDDTAFYRRLAGETGGPILDVGCGTGRVAAALAADGHEVVGVDLSAPMLRLAERRRAALPAAVAARLSFHRADLAALDLGRHFALIVTPAGDVVTCYEVVDAGHPLARLSTVGTLNGGGLELDLEARAELRSRIAARRASCLDCHCYWTCAGDCYVRAFEPGPGGHLVRGERCRLNRTLTREILLRLIAESGGVWRRGQVPLAPRRAAG